MPAISRKALADAVMARLGTVTNVVVYQGEAVNVPVMSASDSHVKPYVVLYASPGTPTIEQDVADTAVDLDWLFQITCAAGYPDDLHALVTRVDAALYRWTPTITGVVCGPCKPPPGFDPGPMGLDRDVTPHRPYMPLQYRCTVTAT